MFRITALLLLLASPAAASNELQGQTLDRVEFMAAANGVAIEKLNAEDTALLDAVTPRPMPADIYLLKLKTTVIIALVLDGVVVISTDPIDRAKIDKILGRSGV